MTARKAEVVLTLNWPDYPKDVIVLVGAGQMNEEEEQIVSTFQMPEEDMEAIAARIKKNTNETGQLQLIKSPACSWDVPFKKLEIKTPSKPKTPATKPINDLEQTYLFETGPIETNEVFTLKINKETLKLIISLK